MQAVSFPWNRQFNAADNRIVTRIFQRHAAIQKGRYYYFIVKNLWNAGAQPNSLRCFQQERPVDQFVYPYAEVRLGKLNALVGIQTQERKHVHRATPVFRQATQQRGIPGRKPGKITGTAGRAQEHHIVTLHPQRLQQLFQKRWIVSLR